MNITQLRLFRDIARELSFIKVAQQNHITQPAVSVHIRKLEDELGKKLFIRTPHNIQLTPEGLLILTDVKEILQLCDGLKVHIHLEYRRFDDIYNMLLKESIDLGIVAFPEKRTKIETIGYSEDELVLIAAKNHRLNARKTVLLKQIDGLPFIAFDEGVPTREATDEIFRERGISVDLRMTNDNIYTIKKAVEANIGVAIVPASSVDEEVHQGTLGRFKIRDASLRRPLALLKLKKTKFSKPLEIFMERLLEFGAKSRQK